MGRSISSGFESAIEADQSLFTHLIRFQFSGGDLLYTTAPVDIDFDHDGDSTDETFVGIGGRIGFGQVSETGDPRGQSMSLELAGVDQEIISSILNNHFRGHIVEVWRVHIDDTSSITGSLKLFKGYQNSEWKIESDHDHGEGTVRVAMDVVSRLAELNQRRGVLTNVESHQEAIQAAADNDDKFFDKVTSIAGKRVFWGTEAPAEQTSGTGGTGGTEGGGGDGRAPFRPM